MPDGGDKQIIHVKRIKKVAGGHHGGAWKIAYADFVTAMMAFFLLMWLLGSTAKGDLNGISEYFKTPLKGRPAGRVRQRRQLAHHQGRRQGPDAGPAARSAEGERPAKQKVVDIKAAEAERAQREKAFLKGLQARVEALIDSNPKLAPYRNQLLLDVTSEGLRIQIVDEKNRPMFDSGSSQLKAYAKDILRELASTLNGVDQRISLAGHTDAASYAFGDKSYSNWELSADRANATRRELVGGGLADNRILRVVGLGSAVPAKPEAPLDASNRRVTIVVMNKVTQDKIGRDGVDLSTSEANPVTAEAITGAGPAVVAGPVTTPSPPTPPAAAIAKAEPVASR